MTGGMHTVIVKRVQLFSKELHCYRAALSSLGPGRAEILDSEANRLYLTTEFIHMCFRDRRPLTMITLGYLTGVRNT